MIMTPEGVFRVSRPDFDEVARLLLLVGAIHEVAGGKANPSDGPTLQNIE
jgi:hypothetical protein